MAIDSPSEQSAWSREHNNSKRDYLLVIFIFYLFVYECVLEKDDLYC